MLAAVGKCGNSGESPAVSFMSQSSLADFYAAYISQGPTEELLASFEWADKDPTVLTTMFVIAFVSSTPSLKRE